MGNFIKKCMSILLLVSIVSTSVFPSSFASYAQEMQSEQIVSIDPADNTLVNSPSDAQRLSKETAGMPEGGGESALKAGAPDALASPLDSEDKLSEIFKIKDIGLDLLGETLINPITGEVIDERKESILIEADYDGASLDNVVKTRIKEVWIDEVSIPMRDIVTDLPNFYLYQAKNITITATYVDGTRAVNDFKKRDAHRVEIVFDDGSRVEYQDAGYTKRDFTKDPAPPPRTEQPPEPINRTVKGYLVKKDNKKAKSMADDALVREVQVLSSDVAPMPNVKFADITISFNPISLGNISGKIKAVSYKAMTDMKAARPVVGKDGSFAISYPEFALPPEGSSKDTEIELEFDIDLGSSAPMKQSAILILDWNDDFKFEGADPGPSPGEETPKPGIADLYIIKDVAVQNRYSVEQLEVAIHQKANEKASISKSHMNELSRVKINGVFFDQSEADFTQSLIYDFFSIEKKVIDQAKKKTPIEMEIWFKDGSMVKNTAKDDTPSQPEPPKEVKGYLLNKNEKSASLANKALRNIEVKPVVSTENQGKKFYELTLNFFSISISDNETVEINKFLYQDGSRMKAAGTENSYLYTIYKLLIPAEMVHSANSTKDTKIAVQYNLNTKKDGFKDPFEAVLLLDWNGDFTLPNDQPEAPGNFAEGFTVENVQLKEDAKEIHVTLNKALEAKDLALVKTVQVDDHKFELQSNDLAQLESGKVLVIKKDELFNKAKERSVNGWTLKVVFKDRSVLSFVVKATAPSEGKVAEKYTLTKVLTDQGWNKKQVHFVFEPKLNAKDAHGIKKIEINGRVFENDPKIFFPNSDLNLETTNEDVIAAIKAKGSTVLKITFGDDSILNYGAADTPDTPAETIASKHKITSAEIRKGYLREELHIGFEKNFPREAIAKIKQIKVNGTVFEKVSTMFFTSREWKLYSSDEQVVQAAKSKTPIAVEIIFEDDSISSHGGSTPPPPTPQPPKPPQEGEAAGHGIREMKKDETDKEFWIFFEKDIPNFWKSKIKKLQINGTDFELQPTDLDVRSSSIVFKRQDILDKVFPVADVNTLSIIITFDDGSQIKKNVVEVPKEPELTITSELQDGEYTLTYQAYKHGSTHEISTLAGFFDVRAKLVVAGEKKTVTLLNHTGAAMMLDFALKTGESFTGIPKTNITHTFKGDIATAQYSFDLQELTGRKVVAVLGSGPMGGNQGEIGQYDNPNYRKADIVFDNEVIKGWTEFKFIEDAKKNSEASHKRLIDGLIKNGVDTNNDGEISEQELRDAKGIRTQVAGKMRSNVIDMEGIKVDDISMLKHLGPGVKFLNLNGCGIKELPQDVFQNATGVRELYLGGNHIKEIHPRTFDKMINLEYIDFDGNRLGAIPEGIFDKNTALESVSFMNSGVTSLPSGMLKNLSKLRSLYLQENRITTLPDDFFEGAQRLNDVHLGHNKLTKLPESLGSVERLKVISAEHNEITRVPDSLANLSRLETLDLESNRVEYFPTSLYENMIRLAAHTQVRLDLSMNDLKELPVDEMIAALESGGKMLTKFEVNKNYLKPVLTKDEENKLKRLGVDFDRTQETYYPQKGSIGSVLTASKGKIELNQEFDILELYYWDQGDSPRYGGVQEFKTKEEFLKYLLGQGRDYHKVDRNIPRDEAIQSILNKKGIEWEVETIIIKNGQELFRNTLQKNPKEGLVQTYQDPTMKTGDRYTLTKKLMIKGVFGFAVQLENTAEGISSGDSQQPDISTKNVKVQINRRNENTKMQMVNDGLNPIAKIEKIGEKYRYTIEYRSITVSGVKGDISNFRVLINGAPTEIVPTPIQGDYEKKYVFELDQDLKRIPIKFRVELMAQDFDADLVFGDSEVQPDPDRMIKAYILKENEDKLSMANDALVHDVAVKTIGDRYEIKLQFNDITMGAITAGIDTLFVDLGPNNKVEATKISKGVFTFKIPVSMVTDETQDTKLPIEFTAKGNGFNKNYKADLLLDWNKNYVPSKPEVPLDGKKIPARVLTPDGKKTSMADKALEAVTVKPSDKTSGAFKLVTMTFKFKELAIKRSNATIDVLSGDTVKASVKTLEVKLRDKWMKAAPVEGQKGVFTLDMFENVILDENALEDTRLAIRITTDPAVQGHTGPQEALLVLDWNGDLKVDDQGNVTPPPKPPVTPPGGGGSGSTEETSFVNVWLKKKNSNEASMGNGSLNKRAKVVRKGNEYTYTLTFDPMEVDFGGQKIRGTVSSINLPDHSGVSITESINGSSKEYTFTLNEKVSELLISFEVDGVSVMGRQEAYVVFDWTGNNSAPIGGGGTPGGAGGTTIPDNQVPLAGPERSEKELVEKAQRIINNKDTAQYKKYYKPETIKAISKALEAHQNKEKDALQKLQAVLESARLERINSILSGGYMSGYPNRQFRPNNKITRAEVSAMFMELIEDEAKEKVAFKDVKDGLWYSAAANKMASLGYIRMSEDGMFQPSKAITRAEYAYILAKLKNLPASDKKMKDVPADHWAASAIASCIEAGIIAGYSDGTFKPDREITRAEAVAMMSRTFEIASNTKNKEAYSDVSKTHWAYDVIMTASRS
ncbi:MAG: S-layer homology domain-containing protein [Peptostreptococcaceae bacterium]|nr:S-layer homology domain-containing protein [Peptostreptococcaceae bacterium]